MTEFADEFDQYLKALIASTKTEVAALDTASANVASETERIRQLLVELEVNDQTRDELFRWIAQRRPHAIQSTALPVGQSAQWDPRRLAAEIHSVKSARQAAVDAHGD